MLSVQERVQNGIAYLDLKVHDWRADVDLKILDMQDARLCVIGQVYGSFRGHFGIGLFATIYDDHESIDLGFALPDSDYSEAEYMDLQDEWVRVLSA